MTSTLTIDSLMEQALEVKDGMITVFPQFKQEEALKVSEIVPKFPGCYATNNSTVAFVFKNRFFAIPRTRKVIKTLHSEGFKQKMFFVPFSNWDYPKHEKNKWDNLLEEAKKARDEEFSEDCIEYCDEHNIGVIEDKFLVNSFEMIAEGVRVKHPMYETVLYPTINKKLLDYPSREQLGCFGKNNGKVAFVYRNGKTYVAKGYKIIDSLLSAGYKETGIFVPFSNGEEIMDPVLKARWESIKK